MTILIDTTLREGEQTPAVSFTLSQKKQIIDGLSAIGIEEIEVGLASPLAGCSGALIRHIRENHPTMRCSLWSRCKESDIVSAVSQKPDILSLSIPVSDILIKEKLGTSRDMTVQMMCSAIISAHRHGMSPAIGFEDATRANRDFLHHIAVMAAKLGVCRIRLADTIGTATPDEIGTLVSEVRDYISPIPVGVHTHNDYGLATANVLSGLAHGAQFADATLLGLGERSGCAKLEEITGILAVKHGRSYNLKALYSLALITAGICKREIPPNQPFLGRDIFTCETGLHLQALHRNPKTYEPYPPEKIGTRRTLRLSEKVGRRAILEHFRRKGHRLPDTIDDHTITQMRKTLAKNPRKYGMILRNLITAESVTC